MKANGKRGKSRQGFVTIYMVFTMLTLIPVAGLAIDFSVLYCVKGRLQQACDAGAVGAGSMVQRSTDVTDPVQNALLKDAVLRFFNANMTPVPWSATQTNYSSSITQDPVTKVRTIYVTATYSVPMMFMRVLRINTSTVAAQATAKIRFVNLMIVVDRSGSVQRTGSPATVVKDLQGFVADVSTSIFVDGRDVVGLLSYGSNYNLDFAPVANFQTATPNISTAINNIFFDTSNSTNTGEGLYQAWYQLAQLNQTGALNAILLITDGRPSAVTGTFDASTAPHCTDKSNKLGAINSPVGDGNPWQFPPPASRGTNGVLNVTPACSSAGCEPKTFVTNSAGCSYFVNQNGALFSQDISTIPALIGPVDHTTGLHVPSQTTFSSTTGYFSGGGTSTNSATAVRYAAFNYADNVATAIRKDNVYKPVIYAIGLNFNTAAYPKEEPLDADWLARVANDPSYKNSVTGLPVFQAGQTTGRYYDVTYNGLAAALHDITSQILRLSQN
ncbi:MAG: VWA domain-containing protein [Acidobacteriia bacterium]|nr:VWA domain-containing protein [Terriglobia bacterium]